MRPPKRRLKHLRPARVLVQQIPQVGGWAMSGSDRQQHAKSNGNGRTPTRPQPSSHAAGFAGVNDFRDTDSDRGDTL